MTTFDDSGSGARRPVVIAAAGLAVGFAGILAWAGLTYDPPGVEVAVPPLEQAAPPVGAQRVERVMLPDEAPEDPPALVAVVRPNPPAAVPRAEAEPETARAAPAPAPRVTAPPEDGEAAPEMVFAALPPGAALSRGVLQPAPLPGLAEETPAGLLPIIAPDGRQPWRVYGRPFGETDRPKVAVLMLDLGLSSALTNRAIQLDGAVTLAFAPYARDLQTWIELARTAGHEVLLQLPMEPQDYPSDDPGPQALLTSLTPTENIERLNWHLARFAGYVGVVDYMGERFARAPQHLEPILRVLKNRGLLVYDSGTARSSRLSEVAREVGVVTVGSDVILDRVAARREIEAQLAEVERLARERGKAVATAHLFPVTLELLNAWIEGLEDKGFVLAPVSAVAAVP